MHYFCVYAFKSGDIENQRAVIEEVLGFSLVEKDSDYYGIAYSFMGGNDENFLLQENYDGEGYLEASHQDFPIIFNATIEGQERADSLKEKILAIEGAILIRSRKLSI